jgi:hypothetical protein
MGGSTGAGSGTGGSGTVVVSSGTVGFMDYAQLETSSVQALTTWLTANGYPYDALATAAFDYYVQQGWLFVTFKVNQGDFTGTTTCKDLGPVKLTFPAPIPVVPTRMATARGKDTSGTLSYATNFSWRIFGITQGSQQVGFADGTNYVRTLNFSGLLDTTAAGALDGLAVAGDRATKMTITFNYGSTDPDVGFSLVTGQDYRETMREVSYIQCNDGGVDSALAPDLDAGSDIAVRPDRPDVGPFGPDVAPLDTADAADAIVIGTPPPESTGRSDAGVVQDAATAVALDAAVLGKDAYVAVTADASAAGKDAVAVVSIPDASTGGKDTATSPPVEPPKKQGGGCSFSSTSSAGGVLSALWVAALVLGLRRRRR